MVHYWEDPFELDDEQDDEGEEWQVEPREPPREDHALPATRGSVPAAYGYREPRALDLLLGAGRPAEVQAASRWMEMRDRLRSRWPRVCAGCGAEFRDPRWHVVRYPCCRRRRRSRGTAARRESTR